MKKALIFLILLLVFSTLSAWDEFNKDFIADELRKPGVKLVALDFYATWCGPCNAAIPKWKKLQEKYGDKGLELIVVSVQSEGSCSQPPKWNPDKIVCDYDGDIADAWHANKLPQAFLWSWQGNLLVAHGGVDNVAAAVEQYFKKIPRVYVEEGSDKNIYKMVRSELAKKSKIEIVASDEERKALTELREKSYAGNYADNMQCKLGEEVSANSRLVISTQKRGKKNALVLELFSAEKGCLSASGTATLRGNPEQEVAEAVYNLLKNLLGDVKMPGEGKKTAKLQKQLEQTSNQSLAAANPKDKNACEFARNNSHNGMDAWELYLKKFPKGVCAGEAKTAIENYKNQKRAEKERTLYNNAKKENTLAAWWKYLREFPEGEHSFEAELYKERSSKIGYLTWSDRSSNEMNWSSAKQYCEDLSEGGFTDWRLPNIDELRTTIKNCSKTEPGGECKVRDKNGCLSWKQCGNGRSEGSCSCEYRKNNGGYYSKLGDTHGVYLWSSSTQSDGTDSAWYVGFNGGNVGNANKNSKNYVRCVR